jgi:hypothetical protein
LCDAFFDCLAEVPSSLDSGDIHEDHAFAEMLHEIVEQAARFSLRVAPSIADEDGAQAVSPEETEKLAACDRIAGSRSDRGKFTPSQIPGIDTLRLSGSLGRIAQRTRSRLCWFNVGMAKIVAFE